jgi:hypothetical protein
MIKSLPAAIEITVATTWKRKAFTRL